MLLFSSTGYTRQVLLEGSTTILLVRSGLAFPVIHHRTLVYSPNACCDYLEYRDGREKGDGSPWDERKYITPPTSDFTGIAQDAR